MSMVQFFERLAEEDPSLSVKYMAHLAEQIQDGPFSAKSQALDARISGDTEGVVRACDRAEDLRDKFLVVANGFFRQHAIIGTHGNGGQARIIFDILERNPVNRDYLTSPREN